MLGLGVLWFRVADPEVVGRATWWILAACSIELIISIVTLVTLARQERWHTTLGGIAVGSCIFALLALAVMAEFGSLPGIFAGLFLAKVPILPYLL